MNKPKLSLESAEKSEWDAADAIAEKRHAEIEKIWNELNKNGGECVRKLMDYIALIEGQNKRLSRRIDMLENGMRLLDRMEKIIELYNTANAK